MHSGLQSSSFSIVDILSGPFLLNVPVYQRPFAWTSEEAGQLLDDIIDAAAIESDGQADADYFLGSVLLMDSSGNPPVKLSKSMPFREFDIVDGQQRLTSLNIELFNARDQPRTALWPVMSISLLKSPETNLGCASSAAWKGIFELRPRIKKTFNASRRRSMA